MTSYLELRKDRRKIMFVDEVKKELTGHIIPFWKGMRDDTYGGYYGWLDQQLQLDKKAEKGCILNSRILWFFSNAYVMLGEKELLDEANHGYDFLTTYCIDKEYGGIYWSLNYDGTPLDTTKHTYNQAFAIYALCAYYEASKNAQAKDLAMELYRLIEERCCDNGGYLEAFKRDFSPESNEKLSENGVLAERTMNTLLHVMEAYTQLYKITHDSSVRLRLVWMLELVKDKIYNPTLQRQEVFFDKDYHSLIDLHSFGHDIEAAWLIDRALAILNMPKLTLAIGKITAQLEKRTYELAYDGRSFANECENGVVNEHRIWWVQAESIVGFVNAYQKNPEKKEYLEAAEHIWEFVKTCVVDSRDGSEWFNEVDKEGKPYPDKPIVEPWKCPYHNGRMCMELMKRLGS